MIKIVFLQMLLLLGVSKSDKFDEDQYGVKYANECEVCKIVTWEFWNLLQKSKGKTEVIETGYSIEKNKKKTKYAKSELRLIETRDSICEKLLEYNVHKEKKDSTRFARGTSETFQALDNLVAKGVKVDLGIPKEMWHKPSAEVTHLKTQCETLLEDYEEVVEDWYFKHQDTVSLQDYLCKDRYLKGKSKKCLKEGIKTDKTKSKGEKSEL